MGKIKADGLKEVANEVIGLEHNKIFATVKYLTINPSGVVSDFCSGEKTKYLSPVVYFLGVESLKLYLMSITGLFDLIVKRQMENVSSWLNSPKDEADRVAHNLNSFYSFFNTGIGREIISLPILLLLAWLFYKRYNHSFKENSWFALYIWGHASLLSIPIILVLYIAKDVGLFIPLGYTIIVLYWTWASTKFYNLKFGKALTVRILMQIAYVIAIGIISTLFPRVIGLFVDG